MSVHRDASPKLVPRDQLRWIAYLHAKGVQLLWKARTQRVILARSACLGQDVLKVLEPSFPIVNLQKGRVDYVADCAHKPELAARTIQVLPHLDRREITGCIAQEEMVRHWLGFRAPRVLFMDSMAELGDQMFVHRQELWRFLCAFGDLAHGDEFRRSFESQGLIQTSELDQHFRRFFTLVRARFGQMPIVYLHFPSKLETRNKYIDRHFAIKAAVERIADDFAPLFSIAIDDAIVEKPEHCAPALDDFAYHYNRQTYCQFADQIRNTAAWVEMSRTAAGALR